LNLLIFGILIHLSADGFVQTSEYFGKRIVVTNASQIMSIFSSEFENSILLQSEKSTSVLADSRKSNENLLLI
jgi:hypothetical protein